MNRIRILCTATALSLGAVPAPAQWSADPAGNLAVADAASDQSQAKLEAVAGQAVYLSWFDGIGSGYDVRLQQLDAAGHELFPHAGVLVADRGFSSTQDYGLSHSATNDALLAFRDDRPGGVQITAAKVTPAGNQPWGAAGIQLTATAAFVASPKIAGTADGGAVVAWTQDSSVRLRKLDASGVKQWASDVVLTPAAGTYSVSDLHAAGNDVVLSIVHQTGSFTSPKQLRTQKFDSNGTALWGASPVSVFDSGSLQFGNFPGFEPDGSGGAVFSWYGTSPLQCWAQHIKSDGTEAYPHNGVAVSTNAGQVRVNPWASYDADNGTTVVSWVEQNSLQSQFGLSSQKLGATGNRLWGAQGAVQIPLGSAEISNVRNITSADTTFVYWMTAPSFGQDVIRGRRLASDGSTDMGPFDVASTPSDKLRVALTRDSAGQMVLAWTDALVDEGDLLAQNVNCDGTLGAPALGAHWTDLGQGLAGLTGVPTLSGEGTLCGGAPFTITLANARPNSSAALLGGFTQVFQPFKGGVLVPSPDLIFVGLPTGPAGSLVLGSIWPGNVPSGFQFTMQCWISDVAGPKGFSASNGLEAQSP